MDCHCCLPVLEQRIETTFQVVEFLSVRQCFGTLITFQGRPRRPLGSCREKAVDQMVEDRRPLEIDRVPCVSQLLDLRIRHEGRESIRQERRKDGVFPPVMKRVGIEEPPSTSADRVRNVLLRLRSSSRSKKTTLVLKIAR